MQEELIVNPSEKKSSKLFFIISILLLSGVVIAMLLIFKRDDKKPDAVILIDAQRMIEPIKPIWGYFGYDEPNFTYMKDGQELLGKLGQLGNLFIRTHHLLTSGDGSPALKWGSTNAYREDKNGKPIYDWTIIDKIFDTYIHNGLKPYVQIGFMPKDLTIHPQDYPSVIDFNKIISPQAGQAWPPKDYKKWEELVYQWTKHSIERYGKEEVEKWNWEVWNEPNIFYWNAKPEDYFKLYDYAVNGVRRALPTAKVGGPETAGGAGGNFLRDFLDHAARGKNYATGKIGSPLDFISFHAKGSPQYVHGHVQMGISQQLKDIDAAFSVIARSAQFNNLPIIISESDPDGCAACREDKLQYRNTSLYASYTAEMYARELELAKKYHINLQGSLTWAFEFENQPVFAGFRVLSTNGVDLPILNFFRMLGKINGTTINTESSISMPVEKVIKEGVRKNADIRALASIDSKKVNVLVWNYHDDYVATSSSLVSVQVTHIPFTGKARVTEYRIDQNHSNAFSLWKKMGSPETPTSEQYSQLEKTGQLETLSIQNVTIKNGQVTLQTEMPRESVSLFTIEGV